MASWLFVILIAFVLASCAVAEVRRQLTTRSWDALGFHETVNRSPQEEDIIIGIIDFGIWPESLSFRDDGLGPPPKKWKGICDSNGFNFTCNNKIIGARFYKPSPSAYNVTFPEQFSPRDFDDHGTHVAATAAGVPVKGVSVNGIGLGTARGAVPRARLAVYKTCYKDAGCLSFHQAIEDAVNDGVDIISISVGDQLANPYNLDLVAAASFYAMRRGVLVSYAAGNEGPRNFRVDNVEPWALTIANSVVNGSEYAAYVTLGNGKKFKVYNINTRDLEIQYPLILASNATRDTNESTAMMCNAAKLIPELVKGKIVLCRGITDDTDFRNTGAVGVIGNDPGFDLDHYADSISYDDTNFPFVAIKDEDFAYLESYFYNSTSTRGEHAATATISKTAEVMTETPRAAIASSRGPNVVDPEILKPDLSAPGFNIIAAVKGDNPAFNSESGTSMACPHASGIAAYVKSFHPSWSPSAIKSALITTATPMALDKYNNVSELAYGAGELNPLGAVDPGLVYDLTEDDYLKYLCQWSKFDDAVVSNVTRDANFSCSKLNVQKGWSLNLPTFSVPVKLDTPFSRVFERELTNVGDPASNYKVIVHAPKELEIKVNPSVLAYEKTDQKLSYTVSINGVLPGGNSTVLSASLVWTDGRHHVKSPIVVFEEFDPKQKTEERAAGNA